MPMTYNLQRLQVEGIPRLLNEIATLTDWEEKRADIFQRWIDTIGHIPDCERNNFEFLSLDREIDHYRINLKYISAYDDWVTANLLIPIDINMNLTFTNLDTDLFTLHVNRMPAVLALHPTSPEGKDDITLTSGRVNRTYGLELVRRGYVVLAPDTITAGERIGKNDEPYHTASFYEKHPQWSAVAKMLTDHIQGMNLLSRMGLVDPSRIGTIGHSLGGYNAYFLAGIDKRVKAVVCSCGFATFANDPEKERWGRRNWFTHIPKVSDSLKNGEVPFEFNEIAALVAPTPIFMWMGQNDKIFPHWGTAATALYDINGLYTFLGAENQFTSYIGNSGHDFPLEIRQLAYSFLDQKL